MYTSSVHSYHYVHIFVLNLYNIGLAKYCTFYKALCKPLVLTACAKGPGAAIWYLYASNLYSNPLVPDFHACLHSTCTMFMLDNDLFFGLLREEVKDVPETKGPLAPPNVYWQNEKLRDKAHTKTDTKTSEQENLFNPPTYQL